MALGATLLLPVCLLLRGTVGIDRFGFLAAWTVWIGVLLAAA